MDRFWAAGKRLVKIALNIDLKAEVTDGEATNVAEDTEPSHAMGSSMLLIETQIPPNTSTRLQWSSGESFAGTAITTPVLVVNGAQPGPTLCLTAAVHGDELIGIEVVRRLLYETDPATLKGALIGVPIVNLEGFRRSTRYLPDRRDLNRFFPGNPEGSSASRLAHSLFQQIIVHCDALVDLHTGSFHRTNLPQLRADMSNSHVADITQGFGDIIVLHNKGGKGTLRRAAAEIGIPSVTFEAGEPMRLQEDEVLVGVNVIRNFMDYLGMRKGLRLWGKPRPVYYKSRWVRAPNGGILLSTRAPGDLVKKGDVLGTVTDPIINSRVEVTSHWDGQILGMALNQVVMPGFATHHIGITPEDGNFDEAPDETLDEFIAEEPAAVEPTDDEDDEDESLPE